MSRQGHKDAPMRYLNPDEVAEKVPILNMDNVSLVICYVTKKTEIRKKFNVKKFFVVINKFVLTKWLIEPPVIFNFYNRNRHHDT